MKYFCIGDEDMVRGFRLAGVDGVVATTGQDVSEALQRIEGWSEIGVVIVTQVVVARARQDVERFRLEHASPLLVEIPGLEGSPPDHQSLDRIARAAIGIRLDVEKGT